MKKRIALSLMTVVASCAIIGGATFALFTDTSSAQSDKVILAGDVDIDSYRDGFDTIPGPMFYTTPQEGATPTDPSYNGLKPTGYWAPGDTNIRSLVVYNKGSLDAVLKQVKAEITQDNKNMASQMTVAVYKVLPKYLANGAPFAAVPGDDTIDQSLLDQASSQLNPLIMFGAFFGVDDFVQALIERDIPLNAEKLWSGSLTDLATTEQNFINGVNMKSKENPFVKRGCLLAFVVHLDKAANDDYQAAITNIGFSVNAAQK